MSWYEAILWVADLLGAVGVICGTAYKIVNLLNAATSPVPATASM